MKPLTAHKLHLGTQLTALCALCFVLPEMFILSKETGLLTLHVAIIVDSRSRPVSDGLQFVPRRFIREIILLLYQSHYQDQSQLWFLDQRRQSWYMFLLLQGVVKYTLTAASVKCYSLPPTALVPEERPHLTIFH